LFNVRRKVAALPVNFEINLPYGNTTQNLTIHADYEVDVIAPAPVKAGKDPLGIVSSALDQPIAGFGLDLFQGARSAVIAINDKTRPVLHHLLLPPLLQRLEHMSIPIDAIELLVATGTHLPASEEEIQRTYPAEIVSRYRFTSHDCDDQNELVYLGHTKRKTPVFVNRRFYESDLRIVTGNIEPHHFMGFSGGVKSAAIGLAGRITINKNHAMLVDPMAKAGLYETNPMRMDIEEIGELMDVHFALNTIQNDDLEIIHALAGQPKQVMQAAIPLSRQACQVPVDGLYDLVIASTGGYPKDINLYQAQKALTHAALITKSGGYVILVAECREGSGSRSCEVFLSDINSLQDVFLKFQSQGFQVGPHKAFQIAREAVRINLCLVSNLPDELVKQFFFHPAKSLELALKLALTDLPSNARIAVMPSATHTIPDVHSE
jgi:lactate racemase